MGQSVSGPGAPNSDLYTRIESARQPGSKISNQFNALHHNIKLDTQLTVCKSNLMSNRESTETVTKRGRAYRNKVKHQAVTFLGGACEQCGYSKCIDAFDFHHIDPSVKEFEISKAFSNHYKWSRVEKELRKCVLLCANCHREVHYKDKV